MGTLIKKTQYHKIGTGKRCVHNRWLHSFNKDPAACMDLIKSHPGCSQTYFNHATGGDGNCGCITRSWTDCMQVGRQEQNKVVDIYAVTDVDEYPATNLFKDALVIDKVTHKSVAVGSFMPSVTDISFLAESSGKLRAKYLEMELWCSNAHNRLSNFEYTKINNKQGLHIPVPKPIDGWKVDQWQ